MIWVKRLLAFVLAVIVTSLVGAGIHSQFVIANMIGLGHAVPFSERIAWTGHDMAGMFPTYAPIIAFAFLLALPIAWVISRRAMNLRTLGYTLAGAAAVICALLVMKQALDVSGVAGARTALGILAQGLAGAIGGWLFARVSVERSQ
jgi:hypothetical protein